MLLREGSASGRKDSENFSIHARAQTVAHVAAGAAVVIAATWVARELLAALVWAAVIAIATWPLYIRLVTAIGGKRSAVLAPLCFTLVVACFVIVPTALLARHIAERSDVFLASLSELRDNGIAVPPWVSRLGAHYLDQWWRQNLSDPNALLVWLRRVNIESLAAWASSLGGALLRRVLGLVMMLIALFVALRDGARLAVRIRDLVRDLLGIPGESLLMTIVDAVRATASGTVVAALVKGSILGLAFVATGVPHPILFGVMMVLLSIMPFGAWIVLIASAASLSVVCDTPWVAVGLGVFGTAVLLIMDHLIQPALIGGAAGLPFLLVLIGVIGGMQSFGLLGLFIGPAIMAALLTIWREWIGTADS
jgi:predicted PurR-regulated permease PerM